MIDGVSNRIVAGVDEVGRGPLAGPLVTAAVILKNHIPGIRDSKKLTPRQRKEFAIIIQQEAICFSYGRAEVHEINDLNIHHATLLAMKRAIEALAIQPQEVLVDGMFIPTVAIPCRAIVNGDALIASIAAASILAKVLRDSEMEEMDNLYPGYGFAAHKGYATVVHKKNLQALGPSPIHRKNFKLRALPA